MIGSYRTDIENMARGNVRRKPLRFDYRSLEEQDDKAGDVEGRCLARELDCSRNTHEC